MNDRSELVAEARFRCSVCNKEAGHIRLLGKPSSAKISRQSFTSDLTAAVPAEQFELLRAAIASSDVHTLYSLDLEYAPFYCPQCNRVYCGDHWQTWDVFDEDEPDWHDSIRGRCPEGHERMLED